MSQTTISNNSPDNNEVSYDDVQISIENTLNDKIDIEISEKLEEFNEVEELIQSRKNNTNDIITLTRKIEKLKSDNKNIERKLWKTCEHVWERDWDVAFDDRCKYYCKVCQLWRNHHLYR